MDVTNIMTQYIIDKHHQVERIIKDKDYHIIIEIGLEMKIQLSRAEAKKILKKVLSAEQIDNK